MFRFVSFAKCNRNADPRGLVLNSYMYSIVFYASMTFLSFEVYKIIVIVKLTRRARVERSTGMSVEYRRTVKIS